MTWTFTRDGRQRHCEIRRDPDGVDYEFVVTAEDGTRQVEHFDDPAALIDRSVRHFNDLFEDGWRPVAEPR